MAAILVTRRRSTGGNNIPGASTRAHFRCDRRPAILTTPTTAATARSTTGSGRTLARHGRRESLPRARGTNSARAAAISHQTGSPAFAAHPAASLPRAKKRTTTRALRPCRGRQPPPRPTTAGLVTAKYAQRHPPPTRPADTHGCPRCHLQPHSSTTHAPAELHRCTRPREADGQAPPSGRRRKHGPTATWRASKPRTPKHTALTHAHNRHTAASDAPRHRTAAPLTPAPRANTQKRTHQPHRDRGVKQLQRGRTHARQHATQTPRRQSTGAPRASSPKEKESRQFPVL